MDLVWSTGARVKRGWFEEWWEELSLDPKHVRMGRLNNGAPLLDSHDMYSGVGAVMGVVEPGTAEVDGKRGTATVRFAKAEDDPAADQVFRKIQDGIIQNVSVGYRTYKLEKQKRSSAANDDDDEIPTYRAIDWEPHELSLVAVGADDGAGVRGGDRKAPTNLCRIIGEERDMGDETETAAATTTDTTATAAADVQAIEARASEAATRAERERSASIFTLVRRVHLGDDVAQDLVARGTSLADARMAVIDRLAEADSRIRTEQHVRVEAGDDARDKYLRHGCAWLFERAMVAQLHPPGAEGRALRGRTSATSRSTPGTSAG